MSEHVITLTRDERLGTLIVRPILPQPRAGLAFVRMLFDWQGKAQAEFETPAGYPEPLMYHPLCPLGVVGDVLLGREAWRTEDVPEATYSGAAVRYRADEGLRFVEFAEYEAWDRFPRDGKWRPAARMPKRFIRWRRTIVALRVQHLKDLSDAEARATGAFSTRLYSDVERGMHGGSEYRIALHEAWNRRWGRFGGGTRWEANPWVWVAQAEER